MTASKSKFATARSRDERAVEILKHNQGIGQV